MPHELSSEMRAALDDADVRDSVTAAVRRRVPGEDVPDVAQAVFCEALDADAGPSASAEIRYWLIGVARHVAVDYFRKRPRELLARETEGAEANESFALPPRFDIRQAVARVLESLGEEAKKTLYWMVLEHEGVELKAIAKEEKISPAAVRARVYRLRRTLRKQLAYLLCGAVLLGGAAEAIRAFWHEPATVLAPPPPPVPMPHPAPREAAGAHVDPPKTLAPSAPASAAPPPPSASAPARVVTPPAPSPTVAPSSHVPRATSQPDFARPSSSSM